MIKNYNRDCNYKNIDNNKIEGEKIIMVIVTQNQQQIHQMKVLGLAIVLVLLMPTLSKFLSNRYIT